MISSLREQAIRKSAREVVCDADFESLPINPLVIAEKKDIGVQSWKPTKPGISGFLMYQGGSFAIGYSTSLGNEGFQNFTVSHELGHYFLEGHYEQLFGRNENFHYSRSGFVSNDKFEREADIFASELLMPGEMISRRLNSMNQGLDTVKEIAEVCKVSLTAAALRYAERTPDPALVVMSRKDSIEWAIPSQSIRRASFLYTPRKESLLPENSGTRSFNSNEENILRGRENRRNTNLSYWIEGDIGAEAIEEIVGLGSYERTLTVITAEALNEGMSEWGNEEEHEPDDWQNRWEKGYFRGKR